MLKMGGMILIVRIIETVMKNVKKIDEEKI